MVKYRKLFSSRNKNLPPAYCILDYENMENHICTQKKNNIFKKLNQTINESMSRSPTKFLRSADGGYDQLIVAHRYVR
jgi:hypothetical protein